METAFRLHSLLQVLVHGLLPGGGGGGPLKRFCLSGGYATYSVS